MVIRNKGRKIINFGQISVLPGETATIPDTFNANETLETLKALGYIEVIESKTTSKGKNAGGKSDKGKTPDKGSETPDTGEGTPADNDGAKE